MHTSKRQIVGAWRYACGGGNTDYLSILVSAGDG